MLVSVVVPVHNGAAHLDDALRRLSRQRYEDLEVVVVDDGSTDGSALTAREAAARDPRVQVVQLPENRGVARAREAGVRASRGRYVWFVDSDDTWSDDALPHLVSVAQERRADVVVAAARLTRTDGGAGQLLAPPTGVTSVTGREALELALDGEITGHLWNKLFHRDLLLRCAFVPARVQSDLALTVEALGRADVVAFTPEVVYQYLVRPGSVITTTSRRAESLVLIEAGVRAVVADVHPALAASDALRYFTLRYIVLSGIKDATLADYPPEERRARLRGLRRRVSPKDLALLLRRRDVKRLALAVTAKSSTRAYRALLHRANG